MESPPMAPNRPKVIARGTRICMLVTPKLPSPAFKPNANPCCFLGKKKLILDMDEAKLPPPKPDNSASTWNFHSGVFISCKAMPAPTAGNINNAVVKKMVLRPPQSLIKKLLGIRSVAPVSPAIAISVNNSDFAKGKPKLSIWTVIIPQYSHTAKPHNRLGIEIHKFLFAIFLPSESQNWGSSTSHFCRSAIVVIPHLLLFYL